MKTKHIVRLGGDEFLVILKNTDKLEARSLKNKLKELLQTIMLIQKKYLL